MPVAVIAFATLTPFLGLLLDDRAGGSRLSGGPLMRALMLGMIVLARVLALGAGISLSGGGSE